MDTFNRIPGRALREEAEQGKPNKATERRRTESADTAQRKNREEYRWNQLKRFLQSSLDRFQGPKALKKVRTLKTAQRKEQREKQYSLLTFAVAMET